MSSAVISISAGKGGTRPATWSLLEVAPRDQAPEPVGVILSDGEHAMEIRTRDAIEISGLEEDEAEVLDAIAEDLDVKAKESSSQDLFDQLEESLSNFLRVSDREQIQISGSLSMAADRLYDQHVDAEVHPFVTHLPMYSLQAAATKFGEQMSLEDTSDADWLRIPREFRRSRRLTENMFIAQVVGRSMEPLIPDGSFCVFRAGVTGSRQGKRLLIEKFGELSHAGRYTVKRYTSEKIVSEETGEWSHTVIRLEPLNREFEAFELGPDDFRVVGEFVEVLFTP